MDQEKAINHIVNWLKDYCNNAGARGFVIGVSGGIDSALTSTLCARTGLPTLCLNMPIHQAKNQEDRGLKHIDWLKNQFNNVSKATHNLTEVYEQFKSSVPNRQETENEELSLANTRSRLRMCTLYYHATLNGYLVAGTGNKVEDFGVGFYTKYGDGGVDLSPIADLTKTQVYELSKFLGVINEILIAPPTDGLWGDDRSDYDQIGASYPELEWAMDQVDKGKTTTDFEGREKEVMKIYLNFNKRNQHKMLPIPVCNMNIFK